MTIRPFFSKSIMDLETMFSERQNEQDFLVALKYELQFRNVNRAKQLNALVVEELKVSSQVKSTVVKPVKNVDPLIIQTTSISVPIQAALPEPLLKEKIKTLKTIVPPEIKDKPDDILSAWTGIEVLSPQSFKKPEELVSNDKWKISYPSNGRWIWEAGGENSQPKKRLYYQIVLGTISMEPAVSALLKVYSDTRAEIPPVQGEAILATIMVDKQGRPADTDSIEISSFAWGVPVALKGDLRQLAEWQNVEKNLKQGLAKKLSIVVNEDENQKPLTTEIINSAYTWLVNELGLDISIVKPPAFAIKTYQYYLNNNPPEALLLNSFFLEDLSKARFLVNSGSAPSNLNRYLGVEKSPIRHNLLTDKKALAEALQPKNFPLSSWPANGRHPLVMLQQSAVNLAMNLSQNGILAVNGPPGTGKTTLLRDVVASIVAERAEIMASYNDPQDAFIHAGQVKRGQSFIHMYKLHDKLRGYEIVVASSNNKAVENVSAELPGIEAIAEDAHGLRYFKSVSDNLLDRDTWGAIAAVLGNGQNRFAFSSGFWWDTDYGMHKYFQHASGYPQLIPDPDDETTTRPPRVIELENPPSDHDQALARWNKAKKGFRKAKKEVEDALSELQSVYELQLDNEHRLENIAVLDDQLSENIYLTNELLDKLKKSDALVREKSNIFNLASIEYDRSNSIRPWFLTRLFRTASYRAWFQEHEEIVSIYNITNNYLLKSESELSLLKEQFSKLDAVVRQLKAEIDSQKLGVLSNNNKIAEISVRYPGCYIDQEFFAKSHQEKQMASPWVGAEIAQLRHALFETSLDLHKAFIDAAAKPIRHNMNLLMDGFGMSSLGNSERDTVIPHLWSTLFLIVPVVSTTFASVGRMFKNIGPEEFGWLLIDEAGQALPQAAIGAIFRARKAVVVGDPIQIEPIVTLPNLLTESICRQFGINAIHFNAPSASAQTLSDEASTHFTTYETKIGTRKVGVPLLVHRRCSSPMFDISNIIAYENMMVQAKTVKESHIIKALGDSHWLHIEGRSQDKWCQLEGEMVIKLLQQLKAKGCNPDLYIVTPFVIVQDRLRKLIVDSKILESWVDNPREWPYRRIGTVHTVQGREAEAVIFVLGAPNPEQQGARSWAGGMPNLLNVAITRAKESVYVVGNKELWKNAGHFQTLARMLA